MQYVWFEDITFRSLVKVSGNVFDKNVILISADFPRGLAVRLILRIFQRVGCLKFERRDLVACKEEVGCADLYYQYKNDARLIAMSVVSGLCGVEAWQSQAIRSHVATELDRPLQFIRAVEREWKAILEQKSKSKLTIVLRGRYLARDIEKYFSNADFNVRFSFLDAFIDLVRLSMLSLRSLMAFTLAFMSGVLRISVPVIGNLDRDSFWIAWVGNHARGGGSLLGKKRYWYSYYVFHGLLDQNSFDVSFYNDRVDSEFDEEGIAEENATSIDLRRLMRVARPCLSDWKWVYSRLLPQLSTVTPWLNCFNLWLWIRCRLYFRIFEHYRVKALLHHNETSCFPAIQKRALEEAGGILLSTHWSFFPFYQEPTMTVPDDIYFVWGQVHREMTERNVSQPGAILPVGVWLKDSASDHSLVKDFVKTNEKIATILDTSAGNWIVSSPRDLVMFWDAVLKILSEMPELALIVKRKYEDDFEDLRQLDGGQTVYEGLVRQKSRILVLNHLESPLLAARYSTLTLCMGVNSAGIVAAVRGGRVLHWNNSRWRFEKGKSTLPTWVYADLNEFKQAAINGLRGDARVGDFSAWKDRFDAFGDDNASSRMAGFVNAFMRRVALGMSRDISLNESIREYQKLHLQKQEISVSSFYE